MFDLQIPKRYIIMIHYILRKIVIVLIIILPLASWQSCKKQAKCGCDGDILFSITSELFDHSTIRFSENGSIASFSKGYDTYYFCNASDMYEIYNSMGSEDQMLLSGDVFWDCSYLMNSSNSYYYQYYKYYNINVTAMIPYLYGKK